MEKTALLIDSDNISAKYIKIIVDELTLNNGTISIKRAYGDWTSDILKPWKEILLEYAITPQQQFSYSKGKNSTDSAMIIDAMDLLYTQEIDTFCLATSDCDFTKIATRLRESGKKVIGMGESKTNQSFIAACNEFKYIDLLYNSESTAESNNDVIEVSSASVTQREKIKAFLQDLLINNNSIQLGFAKQQLQQKFSDFDERNYGYSKFSTFVSSFSDFSIDVKQNNISLADKGSNADEITNFVIKSITGKKKKNYTSAEIQNIIAKNYKDFKLKNLGYSNMKSYLKSINNINISSDGKYYI